MVDIILEFKVETVGVVVVGEVMKVLLFNQEEQEHQDKDFLGEPVILEMMVIIGEQGVAVVQVKLEKMP